MTGRRTGHCQFVKDMQLNGHIKIHYILIIRSYHRARTVLREGRSTVVTELSGHVTIHARRCFGWLMVSKFGESLSLLCEVFYRFKLQEFMPLSFFKICET